MVWRIRAHALCSHGGSTRKKVESTDQPAETEKERLEEGGQAAAAGGKAPGRVTVCRTAAMLGKSSVSSGRGGPTQTRGADQRTERSFTYAGGGTGGGRERGG